MFTEEILVARLKDLQLHITTAESCTGGMIASHIVNVPGASLVFEKGYVTYSNEAKKEILGVREEVLGKYTEYSPQVAAAMAKQAAKKAGADIGISVTGLAGPDGGTKEKPVGLVYAGCYITPGALTRIVAAKPGVYHLEVPEKGKCVVKEYHFSGNRESIRKQAAESAMKLALEGIQYLIERNQLKQHGGCL